MITQNHYLCKSCGKENAKGFLVKDDLWKEVSEKAGLKNGEGALCIECFEKALGRELKWEDLQLSTNTRDGKKIIPPINFWLIEKLMGQAPEQQLSWVSGWLMNSYDYYRNLWMRQKKEDPNKIDKASGRLLVEVLFEESRTAAYLLSGVWEEIERREDE